MEEELSQDVQLAILRERVVYLAKRIEVTEQTLREFMELTKNAYAENAILMGRIGRAAARSTR